MALAAQLVLTGSLAASGDGVATFGGWLDDGASPEPTFAGSVDRRLAERLEAPAVLYGARVVLDGRDVSADLVGTVSIERSIDRPLATARFSLRGKRHSPLLTERTWTRTPAEIYLAAGPPGEVVEHLELAGWVETCTLADGDRVEVTAGDAGLLHAKAEVCFQVAPLAGRTRGELARELGLAAGFAVDAPEGAVYRKPFRSAPGRVLEILRELGEPEGWHWRFRADGTCEAFRPELRRAPEPPDHVWPVAELLAPPQVAPPADVPSRWVVRTESAVEVDELGLVTEVRETVIEAEYAPKEAVGRQGSDGTVSDVAGGSPPRLREVSRIRDELTKRGELPLRQTTVEQGWHNPAAARLLVRDGLAGPGPDGAFWAEVWVDEEGEPRAWRKERYGVVGERTQHWRYDTEGSVEGLVVITSRWHRRTHGVRRAGQSLAEASCGIGSDGVSYQLFGPAQIEGYGQAESQEVSYAYDPATGALASEAQSTSSYFSARATVEAAGGHWLLADGSAQVDRVAKYQLTAQAVKRTLTDASGRLRGETLLSYGYSARPAVAGSWDWGDFRSYRQQEFFGLLRVEQREVEVVDEDSYLEITYAEGERREARHLGPPPLPRYLSSPWVRLVQQPLEHVIDDPVLEKWFGRQVRVLRHEHAQDGAELAFLAERELERLLSWEIRVERPETLAREGETVLLIDEASGLRHRALVVEVAKTRDLAAGTATSRYRLEAPLR